MIICIAGLAGSGKDPIAQRLAKELGIRHISKSQKEVHGDGKPFVDLIAKGVKPKMDRDLDKYVIEEAKKSDCVTSTWLGPWMIKDSTVNIWLNASLEVRAERKAKSLGMTLDEAKNYLRVVETKNVARWKELYGIDILKDHDIFDIEINTEKLQIEESVALIAMLSLQKEKKKFK